MHLPILSTFLPFLTFSVAKPHPFVTRQTTTTTGATIYAYGTNISGLPLVYRLSDGLAYIADTSSLPSNLSAITWNITTDTSTAWNATTSNSTSVGSFFITPGSALGAVGFTSANTTSAVTTTGFSLFGEQVVFVNGSTYESQFWASNTDTDGVWALYWNSDGVEEDGSVPVVLKTIAPSGSTSS